MLSLLPITVFCQDLGNLKEQKPIRFSGSLNLGMNSYLTNRARPSRDPFQWTLSGSPTLTLLGITFPFSFVVSQQNEEFRQPFNQYGLSPYYKWVKLHLGYRNMTFSDYSLNGHQFLGAGLELTPGNWRFGAMYGRLLKSIEADPLADYPVQPTYLRKGFSLKLGYGTSSNYLDLVLFKGWDDLNSIERPTDSAAVNPEQNLVLGLKTQQRLFKKLILNIDIGLSGFTSNLFAQGPPNESIPLAGIITNLLDVNYSTQFLKAGKASLSYRIRGVSLRVQYERVEPEYQTMGAYYFNTDQENITLSPGFTLFKKLRVNGSVGWMRNNLFENKINQTNRRINSLQLSYSPIQNLSLSGSYNNFQVRQQQIDLVRRDVIDSLLLQQFSSSASLNGNYTFGSKTERYNISAGFSQQSTNQDHPNELVGNNNSTSISPNLNFRFNNSDTKWGYNASINYNNFQNISINSSRWGLNVGANKSVSDDKLSLNGNFTFNKTNLDGKGGANTIRFGIRANYRPAEKHTISIGTNYIQQSSVNERIEAFSEFLGNINYSYSF
jgi:hypothetical protein